MRKLQQIQGNVPASHTIGTANESLYALCSGRQAESSREIAQRLFHRPDIGFLMYPTQPVIISTGKQRTNRVENLEAINKSMQRGETSRHGRSFQRTLISALTG